MAALIGAVVGHKLATEREDLNLLREAAEDSMRRSLLAGGPFLAIATAFPAAAADMCDSGRDHGAMHISVEAQNGVLGPDVHPGLHRGFSGCVKP